MITIYKRFLCWWFDRHFYCSLLQSDGVLVQQCLRCGSTLYPHKEDNFDKTGKFND